MSSKGYCFSFKQQEKKGIPSHFMKKFLLIAFAVGSCLALVLGIMKIPQSADAAGYSPAKLKVNVSSINANNSCGYGANHGWICNIILQNTSTNKSLKWVASSQPKSAASFLNNQSNGTLLPGKKSTVQFFVSNRACPSTFTLKFAGPNNTVNVPWSCKANHINVSTTDLTQLVDSSACTQTGLDQFGNYEYWKCNVTLTEANNAQGGLNWTSSIKGKVCYTSCSSGNYGSSISPSKGSIASPSSLNTATIVLPQHSICGKSYVTLSFTFTGPANKVVLNYFCTEEPG